LKRILFISLTLLILSTRLTAQEGVVHDNILELKVGTGYQLDTYLSLLGYSGLQYGIGNEWWQPFRQDTHLGKKGMLVNWAHVGRVDIFMNHYLSSSRANNYWGMQLSGGWGAFYEWKWINDRLRVHVGPYLEGSFTVRRQASNVNKVVSFDVAIDVMATGGVSWSFYGKKTSYRLNYLIRTNLIGFDYLPQYWQSYYEIYEGVPGQARCSGHWNHHTVKHELALDLQFPHSTWRVGVEHEYLNYGTKDLHFVHNQLSFVIGCRWKYRIQANAKL